MVVGLGWNERDWPRNFDGYALILLDRAMNLSLSLYSAKLKFMKIRAEELRQKRKKKKKKREYEVS